MAVPIRTLDLSTFTGDSWAQPGSQTEPPDSVPRLLVTSSTVLWRIVPADNNGDPIDDASTLVDAAIVVLSSTATGVSTSARTSSLVDCAGEPQPTGQQLVDRDLPIGSTIVLAVPSVAGSTVAQLLVFVDAGAGLLP